MNFASGVTIYSQDDDGIGPVALTQDGSEVVVGTGQAIGNGSVYAFNDKGESLWSYALNHSVSSISVSANGSLVAVGGYENARGPSGFYENGALYLFNGQGKMLWNKSLGGPGPTVKLSSDGSRMAVATESGILYMNDHGQTLWSFSGGSNGNVNSIDMSPDGSNLVASVMYRPNTENWSWSFLSFSSAGKLLWNYTSLSPGGSTSVAGVRVASDGSTLASSDVSGENGTLYLFDHSGNLLWSFQMYSPALAIQTANQSSDVVLLTNWSTLVVDERGQLVANYTGQQLPPTTSSSGSPCTTPAFWESNLGSTNVLFLNGQGVRLLDYSLNRTVSSVALSADDRYAAVVSNQDNSTVLFFMSLTESGPGCVSG